MWRLVIRILAAIMLLLIVVVAGGYFYLRQSLPVTAGEIKVPGLTAPVEIVRDADDIPHIFGVTKLDAFYGLGYVHAQDRLWQMEFQRRIGHGRLSEIFGDVTLPQDRFLRTVGFGRAAASAWDHLTDDERTQINAYVSGVNAFISTHHGRLLPPEFTLLRFEPEPFTGVDVMVWVKMMAWDLSSNYSAELLRQDVEARVGPARAAELFAPFAADGLSIVSQTPATDGVSAPAVSRLRNPESLSAYLAPPTLPLQSTFASLTASLSTGDAAVRDFLMGGAVVEALGSNNWVVDGTLTTSGKPLLANDPHLGTKVPSLWYLAHLSAGDFEVMGATLPGTPAVAIGRNRFIAWGETNVAADVEDLVRERLDATGTTAEFRGVQEPIHIVPETIVVKGGQPVHLNVRITRHGPLISDAINANNAASTTEPKPLPLEPLAFHWTALAESDSTISAFLKLNDAHNWGAFTAALRDFVVPSQNFVYADINNHIGYYAPGHIPVRAKGDGTKPVEGWAGDAEWTGWIPFEELPHVFDPPQHFIVTANNRPMPADYPYLIGFEYPEPYRAARITELLSKKPKLTANDFRDIQADVFSGHARALLPLLLKRVRSDAVSDHRALEYLQQWDYSGGGDSAAEAIFQAWFLQLTPTLLSDELGAATASSYAGRFSYITRLMTPILTTGESPWCDNTRTPQVETCDEMVTEALNFALSDLSGRMGPDISRWRWDAVHRAVFPHQGLDAVKLLRPILSRSLPNGGDWSTVNVGPASASSPYDQVSIPGYRQIVDLSSANDSRFLDAVGQSGHFLSPHYDDALADWQTVRHKRMRMERNDINQGAIGHLRLTPQ